jgi:predicted DsbA family dithiol-disulfide isomerase
MSDLMISQEVHDTLTRNTYMRLRSEGMPKLGWWSFLSGLGMTVFSALAIQHFFAANFPANIFPGEFYDVSMHLNCDSFDYSALSRVAHVPLGYFGLVAGCVVCLAALFPAGGLAAVNRFLCLMNLAGASAFLLFTVIYLKTICPIWSGYLLCSVFVFGILYRRDSAAEEGGFWKRWLAPPATHLAAIVVITALGAYGFRAFHQAKEDASIHRAVEAYFSLDKVKLPSLISPYWTVRSTDRFEDAPIQIIEYSDLICDNSLYVEQQLQRLEQDFKGKMNVVFQFFPLELKCNSVARKDKHPGACEAAYLAAYDPAKFPQIHDDLLNHWEEASDPEWRHKLAQRYGVERGLSDAATQDLVHRIIQTGTEFEQTSEQYPYGIRSTPTLIVNHRLIIGTFSYEQFRAIFQRLVDEQRAGPRFMENWPDQPK